MLERRWLRTGQSSAAAKCESWNTSALLVPAYGQGNLQLSLPAFAVSDKQCGEYCLSSVGLGVVPRRWELALRIGSLIQPWHMVIGSRIVT